MVTSFRPDNSTAPTDSVISLGTSGNTNENNRQFVCYCWHSIDGLSKFGTYEGSGSTDFDKTPFIYTGFMPEMVLVKNVDASESWRMYSKGGSNGLRYNPDRASNQLDLGYFQPAQYDNTANQFYILSNGFKFADSSALGNTSNTYMYAAWANIPIDTSNAQ